MVDVGEYFSTVLNIDIDPSPSHVDFPVDGIIELLEDAMTKNFQEERGPKGPWKDVKPATWAQKSTNKMLFESGKMVDSIDTEVDEGEDYVNINVTSDSNYLPYHHYGTMNIPMRRMLWLDDKALQNILHLIEDRVERELNGA